MDLISKARHFIASHYPRKHLLAVSALGILLTGVALYPEQNARGDRLNDADSLVNADFPNQINTSPDSLDPVTASTNSAANTPDLENATPDSTLPQWSDLTVSSGDTLSAMFSEVGLSATELYRVVNSSEEANILNRLYPGNELSFHISEPGQLDALKVMTSPLEGFLFTRLDDTYEATPIVIEPEVRQVQKHGQIAASLFLAADQAEIPAGVIMEMADIFGGVIDFLLDPREGDQFSLIYEEKYLNDERVGTGEIIGAQFINRGREYLALRYQNEAGQVGYFSPAGESMQRAFLRNPLDVFRISSNFNPNRRHPVLNTIRAHKGTDYAAPTGTPIRATADGTVTWAARNGSFGNLVVIKHHGAFETKYAHLNAYANGVKKGSRIQQGQIIGYVGSTGSATGPHLHYEFLINGVHKNPRTVVDQLPQVVSLEEAEMERFRSSTMPIIEQFAQANPRQPLLTMASQ
ncbi:peptidase M23 [Pseudohongiella nitratireducens]|uniref:Peptidase M23 n=1 Tax=Pseudohongiella nitratireducens TaxID=1768907 RepID=A0A916QI18_9GAMM|nr:peptidoglycan DD-metalloendopeptidase family protein [Pseudohongiella nitratireducens]MDF1624102.1 peptidoglycan DD-metalloendopeptidase family protein [Pseudohongiella nitratireducens]GFZ75572.1 peptidase M23 [Pseudohongiella nitratireducens]|tara:strand:+ start:1583 stop:2977 length:1395 start_codon:yes stop_codon:yes gene_type:complete